MWRWQLCTLYTLRVAIFKLKWKCMLNIWFLFNISCHELKRIVSMDRRKGASGGEGSGGRWNKQGESSEGVGASEKTFSLVHNLYWLTVRRETKGGDSDGDQRGACTSVYEWRLSLEGAVRGHRAGTVGTPTSSFSSLSTGPWDPARKKKIDEWYQDKHTPRPPKAALQNDACKVINKSCENKLWQ